MPTPSVRFEARNSADLHTLLKRAAELQGRSVTDFVSEALWQAASRVVEEAHTLRLSMKDQKRFVEAILHPPEPNEALKRAFARRDELEAR